MTEQLRKAFVIGWPISHSLSPALHTYWLKFYGIEGSYDKLAIQPEKLNDFLSELSAGGYVGGNITIPHKEAAYKIIQNRKPTASRLEAANTIWFENGTLVADNTDGYGFSANLDDFSDSWRKTQNAMIIGAGGAARAVAYSLSNAGIKKIVIANRTLSRAQNLAENMDSNCKACSLEEIPALLENTDLLVNTTSMGMKNQPSLDFDLTRLPNSAIVTDIVYNPLITPLLEQAANLKLATIDGIGMLLHQAVPGFEKWFGIRPEVTPELRNHMLDLLKATNQ